MTLQELSIQYSGGAALLQGRIRALEQQADQTRDAAALRELKDRVRMLTAMWRDMREIAVLTEHYYERGHCRNAKYIL